MEEKIVVPKIVFDTCRFYNLFLKKIIGEPYASDQEILEYKEKMEALWNKKKEGILEEIALISGLKWRRTEITCFVVGAPKLAYWSAFSHPLTMTLTRYKESPDRFLINLIHELIHNLFVDNENIYGKEWIMNYLDQKYAGETKDTKGHILVYAFNAHIYCKFFDKERAEEAYTSRTKIADHIRAGEIVREEGYENIIRDFVKHVEEKKRSNL